MDYNVIKKINEVLNTDNVDISKLIEKKNQLIDDINELIDIKIDNPLTAIKVESEFDKKKTELKLIEKKIENKQTGIDDKFNMILDDIGTCLFDYFTADYHQKNKAHKKIVAYIDPHFMRKNKKIATLKCSVCKCSDLHKYSAGIYICTKCKNTMNVNIEEKNKIDNEDQLTQNNIYFNRHITKLQRGGKINISTNVVDNIKKYLNKCGTTDFSKLSIEQVYDALKNINRSDQYFNAEIILTMLNPKCKIPEMFFDDIERIQQMYVEIMQVWNLIKPKNKKSALNVPYVKRKILELLGNYDDYIKMIKLPKSCEKYDKYWYEICQRLDYEFIPTYKF